ncbi:hypothetical protein BU23DRAFT_46048 [Bimuria novae-zelandiae CBS 107.79]|uniref:C2H2-type domain-containing protein n=1 Tax=Bimuria novae-zelandiae CBS 107.79 TaxID=1447943 RepID=A0A6A5VSY3_9PLEO|nr:hypothetical protein BU23DRAFT_46048 [Bimuria novae-zelandiae CBS 107.79]
MKERTLMHKDTRSRGTKEVVTRAVAEMDENISHFWKTVQRRFPRAKHIIVEDGFQWFYRSDEMISSPPDIFRRVAQLCPLDVEVFISLLRGDGIIPSTRYRIKREKWRLVTRQLHIKGTAAWEECPMHPEPSVMVPHKVFRGPVGTFQDIWSRQSHLAGELGWAVRVHRIAAIERHHFYGRYEPFGCSTPDCDAWFDQPEQFTSHAIVTKHDSTYVLPESLEALFTENDKKWKEARKSITEEERVSWSGGESVALRQERSLRKNIFFSWKRIYCMCKINLRSSINCGI